MLAPRVLSQSLPQDVPHEELIAFDQSHSNRLRCLNYSILERESMITIRELHMIRLEERNQVGLDHQDAHSVSWLVKL